jgi:hypothetical protein
MTYLYGAYCAAPAGLAKDPAAESGWYELLASEPLIGGLELGVARISGAHKTLHPRGVRRLSELLDSGWQSVITDIPSTDASTRADGHYGLASADGDGRARAIADVRALFAQLGELQQLLSAQAVVAVQLHSAPCTLGGGSSRDRFADSLAEIAGWNWGATRLCVEHVDAAHPDRSPEKGYLRLEDEIAAVAVSSERSGRDILQSVNWGRSAIEARSAAGPIEHLAALRKSGTLGGLIFSGATGASVPGAYSWQDAHLATSESERASLLTPSALADALGETRNASLDFLGVKMRAPDGSTAETPFEARIAPGFAGLRLLDDIRTTLAAAPTLTRNGSGQAGRT